MASCVSAFAISIHAPCTGSDVIPDITTVLAKVISIHAPCTGSDVSL